MVYISSIVMGQSQITSRFLEMVLEAYEISPSGFFYFLWRRKGHQLRLERDKEVLVVGGEKWRHKIVIFGSGKVNVLKENMVELQGDMEGPSG